MKVRGRAPNGTRSLVPVQGCCAPETKKSLLIRIKTRVGHACQMRPRIRDAETTISIKFAFWMGVGEGGNFTENCPKTLFFPRNSMTIKFGNFANFIVRNLLSFGRLLQDRASNPYPTGPQPPPPPAHLPPPPPTILPRHELPSAYSPWPQMAK